MQAIWARAGNAASWPRIAATGALVSLSVLAACAPRQKAPIAPVAPAPAEKPVAVKPGDEGPMRLLGVSWPFFIFGAAVVAGVAGCQMLAKAFAPPEYDPYADPTQPQL